MKATRILFATLLIAGVAGSVPAASAKKHHKPQSMTMKKGSMKPDPSGQGGSGPGSDQGGTKVSPSNMK